VDELAPRKAKVAKTELDMAVALIDQFKSSFDPSRYHDTYREALLDLIEAKRKGETIEAVPAAEDEEPADLLAALKASVEAAKKGKRSTRARPAGRRKPAARTKKTAKR
jgi:DNA end-binding protein Ku